MKKYSWLFIVIIIAAVLYGIFRTPLFHNNAGHEDPVDSFALVNDDTLAPSPVPSAPDTLPKKIAVNCKTCDIDFLNKIVKLDELNAEDMDYLICTLSSECDNNFDFLEFHNAELFKTVNRQALKFGQRMMVYDSLHWDLIAKQLSDPVVESYTTSGALQALEKANKKSNGELTKMISILKSHMK